MKSRFLRLLSVLLLTNLERTPAVSSNSNNILGLWDISHPLDEGLWSDHHVDQERQSLEEEEHVQVDKKLRGLRNALRLAEIDSLQLFSKTPPLKPMQYSIFKQGRSALRDIAKQDKHLVMPERLFGIPKSRCRTSHYRACAALLLLRGYSDAAHEVLLGVTLDNLKEGEFAATHRGQTDWAEKHPLNDASDMLHAAVHRIVEGNQRGEGGHTGYENACYWLAGGPKLLDSPKAHPVREALAKIAQEHAPMCLAAGIIAPRSSNTTSNRAGTEHSVLSGGGKTRTVCVPPGQWDDFVFLELCRCWKEGLLIKDLEDEVATLQRAEIILLLRNELKSCLGQHTSNRSSSTTKK